MMVVILVDIANGAIAKYRVPPSCEQDVRNVEKAIVKRPEENSFTPEETDRLNLVWEILTQTDGPDWERWDKVQHGPADEIVSFFVDDTPF
jgi:hypothetical protein